jgi:hypothetical protein
MEDFLRDAIYFIVSVWINNFFLDQKNSGIKRLWHMDGTNIQIRSLSTQYIVISCLLVHSIYSLLLPL